MFKQEDEETRRFMEEARRKKMEGGVVDLTREPSTSSGCGCDDCRYGNFSPNFTSFKVVFLTKYIQLFTPTMCHMARIRCHLSGVGCHMSGVAYIFLTDPV